MSNMLRVNRVLRNPRYRDYLNRLTEIEKDREFCRHTMEHFLDTARIMYITALENGLKLDKEIIYAASLLHDIGRVEQYENGTPHDIASANLARVILLECGFNERESETISAAILSHRDGENASVLGELLYSADKKSRLCFACKAESECYWDSSKKNFTIEI